MRRALVDVNVVLDVLLGRAPHVVASTACLAAIESGAAEGLLSAHAVTTIAYLIERALGKTEARRAVEDLCSIFAIAAVDEVVIRRAIALDVDDFEDAVTSAAAEACGCDCVVTRDVGGFDGSPLPALEPGEWLALLAERSPPTSEVHEPTTRYGGRRRRGRK